MAEAVLKQESLIEEQKTLNHGTHMIKEWLELSDAEMQERMKEREEENEKELKRNQAWINALNTEIAELAKQKSEKNNVKLLSMESQSAVGEGYEVPTRTKIANKTTHPTTQSVCQSEIERFAKCQREERGSTFDKRTQPVFQKIASFFSLIQVSETEEPIRVDFLKGEKGAMIEEDGEEKESIHPINSIKQNHETSNKRKPVKSMTTRLIEEEVESGSELYVIEVSSKDDRCIYLVRRMDGHMMPQIGSKKFPPENQTGLQARFTLNEIYNLNPDYLPFAQEVQNEE